MNVCFVANSAWYLNNFRASTLNQFSSFSEVRCLFPSGEDRKDLSGIDVEKSCFYLDASSANPLKELASLLSLVVGLLRHRPEVVFSFNPKTNLYSLMACWLLRIPCVPNVSGVGVASQLGGVAGYTYRTLVRFFYRRASHVFFQNKDDFLEFVDSGFVRPDATEIIPGSGVDLERFTPVERESSCARFLMAARLISAKGVEEYIEAARRVIAQGVDCEFYLAGVEDTSSRAINPDLLKSLDDEPKIHFVGHVKDMPSLLAEIDCVVLPSYYPEGIPRSLIEAAASGKVIITTDTPGCREVVNDGENGFLIQPKSVDDLVKAMSSMVASSADEALRMKRASRNLAETKFDEKMVIQRYEVIAQKLAGMGEAASGG